MNILRYISDMWVKNMSVKFVDNGIKVKETINETSVKFLYEAIAELEAQTKKNTKVASSRTKASITTYIDEEKGEAYVGSDYENFIWEELGTGEFALNGDGRRDKWKYQDAQGEWHTTSGKKPRRMLFNAFNTKKKAILNHAKELFGGMKK